jgi:serine/threonine protein kinase
MNGFERGVPLKVVGRVFDDAIRRSVWREARTAARISHPNICQVFEVGEHQDALFIAMELLQGETLAARLMQGPLNRSDSVEIMLAVLAALGALHAEGIVHRTDVFAAGAVLFEMLAGKPAVAGPSFVDVLHATAFADPPSLEGTADLGGLNTVVHCALAREPSERYLTVAVMAEALSGPASRSSPRVERRAVEQHSPTVGLQPACAGIGHGREQDRHDRSRVVR